MKTRLSVIASAIALVILIIIQYYNISVTFQTKKAQFDTHYGNLVKQGLYEYEARWGRVMSDSVFIEFDNLASDLVFRGLVPEEDPGSDSLISGILTAFSRIPGKHGKHDIFLADYLKQAGADPDFRSGYYIRELSLLDFETVFPVYRDTTGVLPAGFRDRHRTDAERLRF